MEKHTNDFLDEIRAELAAKGLTQEILDDIIADDPNDPEGYQEFLRFRKAKEDDKNP